MNMFDGERERRQPLIIETLFIPVPNDINCVACPDIIPKGQEAFQSPSTPGSYYHDNCFRELVRSTGKDPDKFIRIISLDSQGDN